MPKVQSSQDHIPRPLNCYMLYRAEKLAQWQLTQPDHDRKPGRVANEWRNEPEHVKEKFQQMAKEVAARHALEHPNYRYRPRKRSEKKPTMSERGTASRSQGHAILSIMSPSNLSDYPPLSPLTPQSGSPVTSSPSMQGAPCHQVYRTPDVFGVSPLEGHRSTSRSPTICQPQLAPFMTSPMNLPFHHHNPQRTHTNGPTFTSCTIQDGQSRSAAPTIGCISHSHPIKSSQSSYYMTTTPNLPVELFYDEPLDYTDSDFPVLPPQSLQAYFDLNQRIEQRTEQRWDSMGYIDNTLAPLNPNLSDNLQRDDLLFQVAKLSEDSYDLFDLGTTSAMDPLLLEILRLPKATLSA